MQSPFRGLNILSNVVIGVSWLFGLGAVMGVIYAATQMSDGPLGGLPVMIGGAVMVAAILQAVVVTWIAYFGKAFSAMGNGLVALEPAVAPAATHVPATAPTQEGGVLRWEDAGAVNGEREHALASSPN